MIIALVVLAAAPSEAAAFSAHGSVDQVYATAVKSQAPLELVNRAGRVIAIKRADSLGGVLFRHVAPGTGYRVRQRAQQSRPLTVLAERPAPPDPGRLYGQQIPANGYGYLTTRDGTKLAIDVRPPLFGSPPYPTLVEYAGYGYADPNGPDSGIAEIARALGFAVVDVNMRGTGCSGGAYDYFEPLQNLDGYDVIETVAHQPWALHHKVGMLGISFGGFSQLFVAQTNPPDLAAITPLSDIDSSITILHPGGLLNTGFALTWIKERDHDALPASPTGGQPWAYRQILHGDRICKANQVLHGEAVNLVAKTYSNSYYVPSAADPLDPITFVNKIKAPVFMACQFTDEQTGGHCPDLAEHLTGTRHKWFTFTNGVHGDSLDPYTFDRWYDFMKLFVAHQTPTPPLSAVGPAVYQALFGLNGVTLPSDPIQSAPSYAAALAAFEAQPQVRILFDNGAGGQAGYPYPGFEASFPRFPAPRTRPVSWFMGKQGSLNRAPANRRGADTFKWAPRARPANDYTGPSQAGGLWAATPRYDWTQNPPGTALSYVTAPLSHNTVVIGPGAVQAWIRASVPSVDLQVTITEVRPDGNETFVQNGWLRTSLRALDRQQSTLLAPVLSLRRATAGPLLAGRFTEVTIPLYYQGHVYRNGSRIRIILSAPGGDQPAWAFSQLVPRASARVWLAHSSAMPSRLVLPVVAGVAVPTALPPCPSLRGEPCRQYKVLSNRPAAL